MNIIAINFNSLAQFPQPIEFSEYFRYLETKIVLIKDTSSIPKYKLFEKLMLIKIFDNLYSSMIQPDKHLNVYDKINVIFKARYPNTTFPTIELAINHWMNNIYFWEVFCLLKGILNWTKKYSIKYLIHVIGNFRHFWKIPNM